MNALAAQIEAWYQTHEPEAYQGIEDKPAFFGELADRATEQIEQLTDAIAGPDRPGETYVHKLGRLNEANQAATSQVMRDFAMCPPPPNWKDSAAPSPETPDPSILPDESPEDQKFRQAMEDFATASGELDDQRRTARLKTLPVLPPRTKTPAPPSR